MRRLAAPGTASTFNTMTGTPKIAPATDGATLAYPPTATTTAGRLRTTRYKDMKSADTSPTSALRFETAARRDRLRTNPRPPRRVTGNATPERRLESRPLADPTSSTSAGDLSAPSARAPPRDGVGWP